MNCAFGPQEPIFRKHSEAPLTVLAIKDRVLTQNPLAVPHDSARLEQPRP